MEKKPDLTALRLLLWGAVLRLTHPTRKEPMTFLSAPRGDAFFPYAALIDGFLNDQRKGADL